MVFPGLLVEAAVAPPALKSQSPSLAAELEFGGKGKVSPGTSGKAPVGASGKVASSSATGGAGKLPWLTNELVNFIMTVIGAAVGVAAAMVVL